MPNQKLGTKYVCGSCNAKFYDLGRPNVLCPKCGWDPREAGTVQAKTRVLLDETDDDEADDGALDFRAVFETDDIVVDTDEDLAEDEDEDSDFDADLESYDESDQEEALEEM